MRRSQSARPYELSGSTACPVSREERTSVEQGTLGELVCDSRDEGLGGWTGISCEAPMCGWKMPTDDASRRWGRRGLFHSLAAPTAAPQQAGDVPAPRGACYLSRSRTHGPASSVGPGSRSTLETHRKFWAYVVSGRLLAQAVLCLGSSTPWTAPGGHLQLPRDEPFHVRSVNEAARARRARWASTPAAPPEGSPRATAVCSSVSCASTVQIRTR